MISVPFFLTLFIFYACCIDWPQKYRDSSHSRNVEYNQQLNLTGVWFSPFTRHYHKMYATPYTSQPIVSAGGVAYYPYDDEGMIAAKDLNSGVTLWVFSVTSIPNDIVGPLVVSSYALSYDQTQLYIMFANSSNYLLLTGVNTLTGEAVWWTMDDGPLFGEIVVQSPTLNSPNGWIIVPQQEYADIFIPPLPHQVNFLVYSSRIRSRVNVDIITENQYTTPLGANGLTHVLYLHNETHDHYKIVDEFNTLLADTYVPKGGKLFMVTQENTGVIVNDDTTTLILYDPVTMKLSPPQVGMDIKPAAYFINNENKLGAPFVLFLRNDNDGMVWLQVTPEPKFDYAVLWTVPIKVPWTDIITVTTDTKSFLDGIIYVRAVPSNLLFAISMLNGNQLWNMSIPSSPNQNFPPVIATRNFAGVNSYYLLVDSLYEGYPSFAEVGCCNDHGYCSLGSNTCSCHTNYYGTTCNVFCDVTACEGVDGAKTRGTCGAAGCVCKQDYYGMNCEVLCNAASNCSSHGTCDQKNGACMCKGSALLDFVSYSGTNCNQSQMNWLLIGCIAGGGLVVILIIIIGVVLCTRKRRPNEYDLINTASN